MSTAFQNRLVGTVVLVALAVLLLPEILDGKKQTLEQQFATIPLRPTVAVVAPSKVVAATPEQPQQQDSDAGNSIEVGSLAPQKAVVKPVVEVAEPKISTVAAKPVAEPAAAKTNPAAVKAYTLRLGSFKNAANVNALVARLRQQKYPAYTVPTVPVDGQITRVMIGPETQKARLEQIRTALHKQLNMQGKIENYDPLQL
ncbi:SPOR domain-containing protein [Ferrimonas senticii]|uniref:SPOR domain-containing protein n=1 Tax=Ferrimonas senticii TaxID=394566 RepID=UPI0003FF2EFD|nr:SPOR domain-containing protein [Ferrimonas senticii]